MPLLEGVGFFIFPASARCGLQQGSISRYKLHTTTHSSWLQHSVKCKGRNVFRSWWMVDQLLKTHPSDSSSIFNHSCYCLIAQKTLHNKQSEVKSYLMSSQISTNPCGLGKCGSPFLPKFIYISSYSCILFFLFFFYHSLSLWFYELSLSYSILYSLNSLNYLFYVLSFYSFFPQLCFLAKSPRAAGVDFQTAAWITTVLCSLVAAQEPNGVPFFVRKNKSVFCVGSLRLSLGREDQTAWARAF